MTADEHLETIMKSIENASLGLDGSDCCSVSVRRHIGEILRENEELKSIVKALQQVLWRRGNEDIYQ